MSKPRQHRQLDVTIHTLPENWESLSNANKGGLSKVACYTLIVDDLYKHKYGKPLLKCITKEQAQYVIKEIHEGICGYHSGSQTMTTRILRTDYFWPTMEVDCHAFVKKCIP